MLVCYHFIKHLDINIEYICIYKRKIKLLYLCLYDLKAEPITFENSLKLS